MVTREEILKIAKLSKLSVTEEELDGLTAAMGEIIAFADTINAAGAAAGEFDNINNLQNAFREDERSEEHTSELQSLAYLVCRLLLEKKKFF